MDKNKSLSKDVWSAKALNTAPDSENQIHGDDMAKEFDFLSREQYLMLLLTKRLYLNFYFCPCAMLKMETKTIPLDKTPITKIK
jgi:hypothetical protein